MSVLRHDFFIGTPADNFAHRADETSELSEAALASTRPAEYQIQYLQLGES